MYRQIQYVFIALVLVTFLTGCVENDDPVAPNPNRDCTINISPVPDIFEAPWTLNGPDVYSNSGTGRKALSVYPGDYTIVWGQVPGWATPPQESVTLMPEESTIFHGIYRSLYVQFTTISPGISPNYKVTVRNTIPNAEIRVYVDHVLVGIVTAESSLDIVVEEGLSALEFVMDEMNSFQQVINVTSDMEWLVLLLNLHGP